MAAPQTDEQLHRVLQKLDGRAAEGIIRMKPGDAKFAAQCVERWAKSGPFKFSDPQRQWVEDMEERYL